ncbi:MAG: M48 family metalloprotease, partial [Planctomycetes bacterium]|nr:M48 family metalloprotease [Planctomycetota bacterium]
MTDQLNEMIGLLNRYGETFRHFNTAMFVQVCVLVMILLLVELCLRRKVRAVFRYWMWTLVLLKLVLPVTLYSPASAAYWLTDYRPEITMADLSDFEKSLMTSTQPVPSSVIPAVSDSLSVPLTDRQIPDNQTVMTDQVSPETKAEVISARGVKSAASFNAVPATLQQLQLAGWLLLVWLSITILLGCVVLWRAWRVQQIVIQSVAAPDELIDLLENCCSQLGLKQGSVQLKISNQLGSPAICGLWKPTVLLPRHLLDKLDREQFLLVFYHELSHWKRFDLHVNCLQTLLQVLYFYNPLVWFANAILRRLREQAVDETVLVALSAQAEQYSTTLLDIAALKQRPAKVFLKMIGVAESRHALAQRIRRIVSQPIPKSAKLGVSGFAAIALVGTLLLPMSGSGRSHAAGKEKRKEAASTAVAVVATEKQTQQKAVQDKNSKPAGILHGRIVDETGIPVTDATLRLIPIRGGPEMTTKTDDDGHYFFAEINKPGEHWIRIKSQRCVG